jgi:hypothetical protein
MNSCCSPELLESALAGSLSGQDESELGRHLESCQACSSALEQMAGGREWCRDAASLLAADDLDVTAPSGDKWSEIDFTVEHLEPSDDRAALGKLGGYELNFASDVDLMYVYTSYEGSTSGLGDHGEVQQQISNHEYFITLARRLTTLIGGQGPEGQAARVDMAAAEAMAEVTGSTAPTAASTAKPGTARTAGGVGTPSSRR